MSQLPPMTVTEQLLLAAYQDFCARKLVGEAIDAGWPVTVLGRNLKAIIPVDWVEKLGAAT